MKIHIKQLKKELGLSNNDIAEFFDLSPTSYANSSAKKRYENALCRFYEFVNRNKLRAFKQFLQSDYNLPISNRMIDEFEQKRY